MNNILCLMINTNTDAVEKESTIALKVFNFFIMSVRRYRQPSSIAITWHSSRGGSRGLRLLHLPHNTRLNLSLHQNNNWLIHLL